MNHYNRTNPFLYVLDQSNDILISECHNLIKIAIVQFILNVIWIVEAILYCIAIKSISSFEPFLLIMCILENWFVTSRVMIAISHNKQSYINRKKYPDNDITTYVTLNNEEMFNDTINISTYIGQVRGYKSSVMLIIGIIMIGILIYFIKFLMILI